MESQRPGKSEGMVGWATVVDISMVKTWGAREKVRGRKAGRTEEGKETVGSLDSSDQSLRLGVNYESIK